MIKIFLADDHYLIRQGLKKLFGDESDLKVVGDTASPFDVIPFIEKNDCDILILDINFPAKDGIEILKEIKERKPSVKVLMLSMNPEERYALRTIKAGASGYLSKDASPEELILAVKRVASGRKYITPSLAERMAFEFDNTSKKSDHEELSDREFQVLRMLASGLGQKEIAEELSLSPSTINSYRSRVFEKLGFNNNSDLVQYALMNKLIDS
ncbi:MAG: response regulator transcription factor [Melioribacteraceae bacterium]